MRLIRKPGGRGNRGQGLFAAVHERHRAARLRFHSKGRRSDTKQAAKAARDGLRREALLPGPRVETAREIGSKAQRERVGPQSVGGS